jgi:uncharacterized membrane protein
MLYILFYLAFCLYLGYVLRTPLSAVLLLISLVAWVFAKYDGFHLTYQPLAFALVVSYLAQWVVLLYCLPKRALMTEMSVKNCRWLNFSSWGIVITGAALLVITLWFYMLKMQLTFGDDNPQQLMYRSATIYQYGIIVAWASFAFYLIFWVQISKLLGEVIRDQLISSDDEK